MLLSKEEQCLIEIKKVLNKFGYDIVKIGKTEERTSVEEAFRKVKRTFGILKNYRTCKTDEEFKNKCTAIGAVYKIDRNKVNDITQCEKILGLLGNSSEINDSNVEDIVSNVTSYLETL